MLHKFFEPGDWFAAKKVGYGSGLPIAWQGWFVLIGYIGVMGGFGFMFERGDEIGTITSGIGMFAATGLFLWIARARTAGGWKWRDKE